MKRLILPVVGRHNLLHIGLAALLIVAALTWLNLRAQAVKPELHFAYTQNLRDLRDLNARIDNELLASRLERTRNYDALTLYTRNVQHGAERAGQAPAFIDAAGRQRIAAVAGELHQTLARKADLVDQFKRSNAVLRNSMAYFVAGAEDLLVDDASFRAPGGVRREIGRYVREVLVYAHAPDADARQQVDGLARRLDAASHGLPQRPQIATVLRHGQAITACIADIDTLSRRIAALHSNRRIDALSQTYTQAHGRAVAVADRYRQALYLLDVVLTVFLAWLFLRLAFARRSLAQAHQEVSQRYAAQLAAEQQLRLHATAFRNAHEGITLTDATGHIVDVNPAFTRITGWERDEAIGQTPRILKSGHHDEAFYAAMWQTIRQTGTWSGEIWNRNRFGDVYPELLSISMVRDAAGEITNYVAVFADIGRLKTQERQLRQMAYHDALTELPNRKLLADRLTQGIAQARRSGSPMAVCYLDLDGFKPINDRWGHEAGDRVLVEMSTRLKQALRGGDTVARLGGDEFALLLLDLADQAECEAAVQRLIGVVAQPLTSLPEAASVSASIGVTLYPADDADAETLLRHADQAMYQAKQAGKNGYRLFDAAP